MKRYKSVALILIISLLLGLPGLGQAAPTVGPTLSIQTNIPADPNSYVSVPVHFAANTTTISSIVFSIDYDETWLNFDTTVPMSITFNLPAAFIGSCQSDLLDTDGEIDCFILDPIAPLATLPDGDLMTIKLQTLDAPSGTLAPVNFSTGSPPTSFGSTSGQSVAGTTVNGSVLIGQLMPVPVITSINPTGVAAGSPAFTLNVYGSNFTINSIVRWNGADLVTTFVNSGQLNAQVPAGNVAAPGSANITVYNPPPGGGTSNTVVFQISGNPLPVLNSLNPSNVPAGNPTFNLTAYGLNFIPTSVVRWNGIDLPTTYVSGTQLVAQVAASRVTSPGTATITVYNPPPDGGTSNSLTFTIGQAIWKAYFAYLTQYTAEVSNCYDLIVNGGFESPGVWDFPATEYTAGRSTAQAHSGSWSARTGIVNPYDNRYSYSSTRQLVYIPGDAVSATARFYTYPIGDPYLASSPLPLLPAFNEPFGDTMLSGDVQYVLVLNIYGNTIGTLVWRLRNVQRWQVDTRDLLSFAGKWIYLHFGTYNDGYGGVSALYVDDVSLTICK